MRRLTTRFERVKLFASALRWKNMKQHRHVFPPEVRDQFSNKSIVWFEAGAFPECFLQINLLGGYKAAVYALKYRICTGWHPFVLGSTPQRIRAEARRLHSWLAADWFESPASRRALRKLHPECANYTWGRVEREGVPLHT